jgi:hypothetical protein
MKNPLNHRSRVLHVPPTLCCVFYGSSKPSSTSLKPTNECPECQRCRQDRRTLQTTSTCIEGRPTGPLVAGRGPNSCYPSPPPRDPSRGRQRSDEREGWRYLFSRGKERPSPSSLCSLYWPERRPPKSGSDHPPTYPCSSSRPMARLVLAGTLSISDLQRSDS